MVNSVEPTLAFSFFPIYVWPHYVDFFHNIKDHPVKVNKKIKKANAIMHILFHL